MANIKIYDLHSTGSDLFQDSESYMNELGDGELSSINGGWSLPSGWKCSVAISLISAISVSATATGTPTVTVVTATA